MYVAYTPCVVYFKLIRFVIYQVEVSQSLGLHIVSYFVVYPPGGAWGLVG